MTSKKTTSYGKTFAEAPRNMDEFIEQGWVQIVERRVRRKALKDVNNSPEDLAQDILLSLISTDYIQRFNPEFRTFEVYLYVFIDNYMKKKFQKENTRNGKGIVNRASLEISMPDSSEELRKDVVYMESLQLSSTLEEESTLYMDEFIESVREELSQYKASSSVEYNGRTLQRDPVTVFDLMLEDYTVAEIAEMFDTSKQFIYNLLKKIRSCPTIVEAKLEMGLRNR